jgi:hypothetical protein
MPCPDTLEVTHRQLAELQRTLGARATQLEQVALDLSRLVGGGAGPTAPAAGLLDPAFRDAWAGGHLAHLRALVDALEAQGRQLGERRRHLLPASDPSVVEP